MPQRYVKGPKQCLQKNRSENSNKSPLKCMQGFVNNVPASRAIYQSGPSTGLFRTFQSMAKPLCKNIRSFDMFIVERNNKNCKHAAWRRQRSKSFSHEWPPMQANQKSSHYVTVGDMDSRRIQVCGCEILDLIQS